MIFFKPNFWDKNKISLFSIVLYPIVLIIKFFNFLKKFFIKTQRFTIPIICVGNIYLGGTGKTPFCIELFSILKNLNKKPSFIRKKYKSFEDEVLLLKKVGKVYENIKRKNAIEDAIQNKSDVLILDDGFQDISIKKDISIICFNEKQWIGNGLMIPSGPLREELSALKRVDYVIINGEKNTHIEKKILEKNKSIKIYYIEYKPENISIFKNKKVICFAGIGNPINFFNTLEKNQIDIIDKIGFPDHYTYSDQEIEKLIEKAKQNSAILLTTEKDYLRINENYKKNINFLRTKPEMKNKEQFVKEIEKKLWKV